MTGALIGMSATTGQALTGLEHLRQSITDILTTPIGARVMRRDYGSDLFNLLDHPGNKANLLRVYAATIEALLRFEPRIKPRRVQIDGITEQGHITLTLDAIATFDLAYVRAGQLVQLDIPIGVPA